MAIFSDFPIFDFKTYKDKEHKSEYSLMIKISHKPHTMYLMFSSLGLQFTVLIKHVCAPCTYQISTHLSLLLKIKS